MVVIHGRESRNVLEHASAGMVGVNVGVPIPRAPLSFGGEPHLPRCVRDITGRGWIEF
jgi:malonate-semialdehyde dehydrogenase (acetylating)/methylmalonate-semialdehyde dehydrogenase